MKLSSQNASKFLKIGHLCSRNYKFITIKAATLFESKIQLRKYEVFSYTILRRLKQMPKFIKIFMKLLHMRHKV